MRPIVDGLQDEFGERAAFLLVNAADGAVGEAAFRALALPGHPSVVIFGTNGVEVYRGFGLIAEDVLRDVLERNVSET